MHLDNGKFDENGVLSYTEITGDNQEIYLNHSEVRYNLVVSVEWDAKKEYLESVNNAFRQISNLLYDITDGQACLDTVFIGDDMQYWNKADIRIRAHNSSRPIASINGIISLLKLLPFTETDLSGATITQGGTSNRVYTINSSADTEQITFTSNGTMSATGSSDGPWSGTWSALENSLTIIDGNEWSFAVLLDGSLADGGSLLVGDAIFTGLDQDGEPNLVWQSFFFISITPVSVTASLRANISETES